MTGGKLEWKDGTSPRVLLTAGGQSKDFSVKKGEAIVEGNYSYLDVSILQNILPTFRWKDVSGNLELEYGVN